MVGAVSACLAWDQAVIVFHGRHLHMDVTCVGEDISKQTHIRTVAEHGVERTRRAVDCFYEQTGVERQVF